jgi:hypothetical protein
VAGPKQTAADLRALREDHERDTTLRQFGDTGLMR